MAQVAEAEFAGLVAFAVKQVAIEVVAVEATFRSCLQLDRNLVADHYPDHEGQAWLEVVRIMVVEAFVIEVAEAAIALVVAAIVAMVVPGDFASP